MTYFRRYLEKCVRYFNFLPDHSTIFFSFTTILELLYLTHFAQKFFPVVRHLLKFFISLVCNQTSTSRVDFRSAIVGVTGHIERPGYTI